MNYSMTMSGGGKGSGSFTVKVEFNSSKQFEKPEVFFELLFDLIKTFPDRLYEYLSSRIKKENSWLIY